MVEILMAEGDRLTPIGRGTAGDYGDRARGYGPGPCRSVVVVVVVVVVVRTVLTFAEGYGRQLASTPSYSSVSVSSRGVGPAWKKAVLDVLSLRR